MAPPLNTRAGRPSMPVHHSFHDYGDIGRSRITNEAAQITAYEGYNITPNESRYDQSNGKWYRAHTKPMPGSQQEFENLVRKQSQSDDTVMELLYSSRMMGSKREHIENYINARNASDPERKHQLAYLRLERFPKHKTSRQSSNRTASMQIVLECKLRSPNDTVPMQPLTPHSSTMLEGNRSSTDSTAIRRQPSAPPPRQAGSRPNSGYPNVHTANRRDGPDPIIPALTPVSREHKIHGVEDPRPLSPCSMVSSDTGSPSSRKMSSSSMSIVNESAPTDTIEGKKCLKESHLTDRNDSAKTNPEPRSQPETGYTTPQNGILLSDVKHRAAAIFSRIDMNLGAGDPASSNDSNSKGPQRDGNLGDLAPDTASCKENHKPNSNNEDGTKAFVEDGLDDHCSPHFDELKDDTVGPNIYEKPVWMNNLQPVNTTTIKDDNVDPLDGSLDSQVTDHKVDIPSNLKSGGSASTSKSAATGISNKSEHSPKRSNHIPAPVTDKFFSIDKLGSNSSQGEYRGTAMLNHPVKSQSNVGRGKVHHPGEKYTPAKYLTLDTKSQHQRQLDEPSHKQRKRVTFSLPSPPSTVASTPIGGTPPSSPDTASSSSSEHMPTSVPSKSPANTGNLSLTSSRPPLCRSSLSSSSHTGGNIRSHEAPLARSTSYVEPPTKGSNTPQCSYYPNSGRSATTEKITLPPIHQTRYHPEVAEERLAIASKPPEPAQPSKRVVYRCEIEPPCDGSQKFDSKAAFEAHQRTSHTGWRR